MAKSTRLEQMQQQQLRQRLNPRQVRFGRVLEMSEPEFEEEVRRVLDENPALEEVQHSDVAQPERDSEADDFNETAEQLQNADYRDPDDIPSYRLNVANRSADDSYYEPIAIEEGASGILSLVEQLADFDIDDLTREIATYIIGNIDSNGYLTRTTEDIAYDIAMGAGIDVSTGDVESALSIVRNLDPAGICAIDLRDCLLLQLERMEQTPEVANATTIIRDRFNLFSKKHFEQIMTAERLSESDFRAALRVITSLNPKPGSLLETVNSSDRLHHISPDFNIDVSPEGEVTVALAGRIPELNVEESFCIDDEVRPRGRREADTLAFIRSRRDDALDFIAMARMRSATLMAVMEAIVRLQPEFFRSFDRAQLRPMVLRDVRELTGLDLSVISRATASKYAMTPFGMFALKSFFSESIHDDDDTSVHAVREAIRKIIDNEDKKKPLSDDAICKQLKSGGFDVARRTVAKYREGMNFPVARLRRE